MNLDDAFYVKVVELVITIVCIVLTEMTAGITSYETLVFGTLVAFTIICGVIVIGYIMDAQLDKNINGLFSVVGCILFITGGALIISEWINKVIYIKETRNKSLATGSLMIINGVVFLVDAVLIYRK